jgi:hypothetical protein
MVLRHFLEGPGGRALFRIQTFIEVEAIFLLDVPADEGRVGQPLAVIIHIGQLALGRLAEVTRFRLERLPAAFEQNLGLGDEGAGVGKAKRGTHSVKRDHRFS